MPVNFKLSCSEIAKITNGKFTGKKDVIINGLNNIEFAKENEITFLSEKKYLGALRKSNASCIIVNKEFDLSEFQDKNFILVDNAHLRFAQFIIYLVDNFVNLDFFIHPKAVIDESSQLDNNVNVGANTVIGKNCKIASDVYIYPNVTIYDNVTIGSGTVIHSGVVICNDTIIGKNCNILPGAILGSEGFGFLDNPDGSYTRIPQIGNVVLGDNVEIGANTTVDRALVGSTIIADGVKLDNLIQIAHNVIVEDNTAMAAQSGISGSTKIGKRNKIAGQVGIAGHISTTDDVVLLAQSGVAKSIEKPGAYFGTPIKERMLAFKIEAVLVKLPELYRDMQHLIKKLDEIDIK